MHPQGVCPVLSCISVCTIPCKWSSPTDVQFGTWVCWGTTIILALLNDDPTCSTTFDQLKQQDSCPNNGNWAMWGNWQMCSTTCGPGLARRTRTCSNPKPSVLGRDCQGDENDYKLCINDNPCAINGFWSDWSQWSCSFRVNHKRVRSRKCYGPMLGGIDCFGNTTELKPDPSCTIN